MSGFFKSAAFPILIVVVLAFFAQKLIGSSSHSPNYTYGQLVQQIKQGQVKSLSLDQKENSASVTLDNGQKYSVGYPDSAANSRINNAIIHDGATAVNVQSKSSNGWLSLLTYVLPFL